MNRHLRHNRIVWGSRRTGQYLNGATTGIYLCVWNREGTGAGPGKIREWKQSGFWAWLERKQVLWIEFLVNRPKKSWICTLDFTASSSTNSHFKAWTSYASCGVGFESHSILYHTESDDGWAVGKCWNFILVLRLQMKIFTDEKGKAVVELSDKKWLRIWYCHVISHTT
jgi:hypothetical protein